MTGFGLGYIFGAALGNNHAAAVTTLRSHVNNPVSRFNDFQIMLDHHNRIALINQLMQHFHEFGNIVEMQAGRGLIQNI